MSPRADLGDRRGLGVALCVGFRVERQIDRELGDAGQAVVAVVDRMRQRDVARLLALRQDGLEAVVDVIDEAAPGPEVRRHLDDGAAAAALHVVARLLVDADIGAAEAVDRLLRVADEEQRAGAQHCVLPLVRAALRRR